MILRSLFVVVASGVGYTLMTSGMFHTQYAYMFIPAMIVWALMIITTDMLISKKRVDWLSSIYFGMLVGLLLTAAVGFAISPLFPQDAGPTGQTNVILVVGITLCYVCTSFLLQTKDDFRFIIPYVEFRKNLKGNCPLVLDTSVVIDGRIADVIETMIVDSRLVMPRFAINELQRIADSSDRGRRTRGRRGLDILNRLQKMKGVDVQIDETELPEFRGQPVDLKLITLAKHLEGKLVTNDYNLNKVAKIHGVDVINLNDLANAMKPVFLPGERLFVDIVKSGEEPAQGIGYLDDGTMVVVDNGREHVGERVEVTVTSVLQTSAGRMIFGRYESTTKKLSGTTVLIDGVATIVPPANNTNDDQQDTTNQQPQNQTQQPAPQQPYPKSQYSNYKKRL
ncbi:MAG: TRAM domain-containing protein [Planctomycetaceae bacterium]|nr:TRAM domain-containing protein [Planctomycetaceae bacterium]